ncbi:C-X-C motif chemokine 11-1-like [Hoplias malabaricus]|uniref:C-X-C motif chemokine 11-1-like n=1 Tax=Hoplias malabaricus TaxID=27720 RepID=UPI003462167B
MSIHTSTFKIITKKITKENMKCTAAVVILACLVIVHVQGQARPSVMRCLCQGAGVKMLNHKRVEKIEVYPPGPSCGNMEIIVYLKNGAGVKCLNSASKFAQNIIRKFMEKRNANQAKSP